MQFIVYGLQVDVIYFASSSVEPSLCTIILLEPCGAEPYEVAATSLRPVVLLACMDNTGSL